MKSIFSILVPLFLVGVVPSSIAEVGPPSTNLTASARFAAFAYAGVGTGGADAEREEVLLRRVALHVEKNLRVAARFSGHLPASTKGAADLGREYASLRKTDEAFLLLFVAGVSTNLAHGVNDASNRVAVINLGPLRDTDPEIMGRRVEKQAIRALCFLMQMKACPNPYCSLFPYRTIMELDSISRNPCPPCSWQFEKVAGKEGLALKSFALPEEIRKRIQEKRKNASTNRVDRAVKPGS